jgi:hypothetical protein
VTRGLACEWVVDRRPPTGSVSASSGGIHVARFEGNRVMRLELTCETCGSQIADPPKTYRGRPVRVCCKASLAKAKGKH